MSTQQINSPTVGNTEVEFSLAGCRAGREQSIGRSSQVQTIADYAKLSLSGDQPIMLALKKVHPLLAAALCIKTHSALLAAWIESNILLQLASAPFDKQDETLVPEAGSCANCPKRTGFNKLLFPDVRKDSCTSPDCFRAKIDASVRKTLETKPAANPDFGGVEFPRGRSLGTESVCGVGDQETEGKRCKHQALS